MPWNLIIRGRRVAERVQTAGLAAWENITALLRKLKGKKLAVLGEQRVGKTCLIDFLTKGSIPKRYEPNLYAREVPGRSFKLRGLKLNIPPLRHLPGSEDEYAQWKEVANEADIVLYLLRVDRLMTGHEPTEKRVRKDMGQIRMWPNARNWPEKSRKFPYVAPKSSQKDPTPRFYSTTSSS